jgi:hypothetical protein
VLAAAVGAEVAPLLDDPIACDDAVTELRQYSRFGGLQQTRRQPTHSIRHYRSVVAGV